MLDSSLATVGDGKLVSIESTAKETHNYSERIIDIFLAQPLNELSRLTLTIIPRYESKPKSND